MTIFNISDEFIERAHQRYDNIIRRATNERINKVIKYAGYTVADLACVLDVDIKTMHRYTKDYTKMPLKKMWLLGRCCNVQLDCFAQMGWLHSLLIKDMQIPETD